MEATLAIAQEFEQSYAVMLAAKVEIARVRLLNEVNRRNTAYAPKPPSHRASKKVALLYTKEAKRRKLLLKVKLATWVSRISEIPDGPCRAAAARIIWWDYLSLTISQERKATSFNAWLNAGYESVNDGDLELALHACGYSPWQARNRISAKEFDEDEE